MTRTFGVARGLYAGAVLMCAFAGCAKNRQFQHATPGPAVAQSATAMPQSSTYSTIKGTTEPPATPGSFGSSSQTITPTSNVQSATPRYTSPPEIVTPGDGRMFSSPGSCNKPGCNSCRN